MTDVVSVLAIACPEIQIDEGCVLTAYPDPISGGAPWTIGYGHTGREVHPGLVWTQDEADDAFEGDCEAVCQGLSSALPWWLTACDAVRAAVLVDMAFELGVHGLMAFTQTLAAVRGGEWAAASGRMLLSKWSHQVPERAERLAAQMRTGVVAAG